MLRLSALKVEKAQGDFFGPKNAVKGKNIDGNRRCCMGFYVVFSVTMIYDIIIMMCFLLFS